MQKNGIIINEVEKDSLASQLRIEPGDLLLAIDNKLPEDLIDYKYWTAKEEVSLRIAKKSGEIEEFVLEKDSEEPLGLYFTEAIFDGIRCCRNKCVFCFVDQMPTTVRKTLKIKDDDYRLSFLQGAYITLSNLMERDWQKIKELHLSPLYVSVHATNEELRKKLLGIAHLPPIGEQLKRLQDYGIQFHVQIVICPDLNDGFALEQSIQELLNFYPALRSIALVPVGLTQFRQNLFSLRPLTKENALSIINTGKFFHQKCNKELGEGIVYLADEFFVKAELPMPGQAYYDDFPQLSNGVGLWRLFLSEFTKLTKFLPRKLMRPCKISLVTGISTQGMWPEIIKKFKEIEGLTVTVYPMENRFFGPEVTVTGLLTGSDLCQNLRNVELGDKIFISSVMLKAGETCFLDNLSVNDIAQELHREICIVPNNAQGLVEAICKLQEKV